MAHRDARYAIPRRSAPPRRAPVDAGAPAARELLDLEPDGGPPRTDAGRYKVVKKLKHWQPGAVKLADRYGDALVCVRHRVDASGRIRATTVELVVERAWVKPRGDAMVAVRLRIGEQHLRVAAMAEGAVYDASARVWRMPRSVAKALDLTTRIVREAE